MDKYYYERYLLSPKWAEMREKRYDLDEGKCQCCGHNTYGDFHTHHLTYKRLGHENIEDIITLCPDCHYLLHSIEDDISNDYEIEGLHREMRHIRDVYIDEIRKKNEEMESAIKNIWHGLVVEYIKSHDRLCGGKLNIISSNKMNKFAERVRDLIRFEKFENFYRASMFAREYYYNRDEMTIKECNDRFKSLFKDGAFNARDFYHDFDELRPQSKKTVF